MTYRPNDPVEILGFDLGLGETWEAAKVVKPRASELPKPGPDWHMIRFTADKAKLYVHETRLRTAEARR